MKACTLCGETKDLELFYNYAKAKDGKSNWCKKCVGLSKSARKEIYGYISRPRPHPSTKCPYPTSVLIQDQIRRQNEEILKSYRTVISVPIKIKERKVSKRTGVDYLKWRARKLVELELRYKRMQRPEECGSCGIPGTIEAHHIDYSKPLDVVWLCRSCHMKWHKSVSPLHA